MSTRRRRGGSVLEFVVASALILVVIASASVTMATVQRSVARDRARDSVTTLAAGLLEQAALYDCQLQIEPSTNASENAAGRALGETTPCTKMMYPEGAVVADLPLEGDMVFGRDRGSCSTDCLTTVVITSRWMPVGERDYECRLSDPSAGAPVMLERRATLTWTPSGATTPLVNEYVSVEAAPRSAGFTDPSRASVAVTAFPGEIVLLKQGGAVNPTGLVRIATPCTSAGTTTAEAWFPFLDSAASYAVVRTGLCVPVDGGTDPVLGCAPVDLEGVSGPLTALYQDTLAGAASVEIGPAVLAACPMSEGTVDFSDRKCTGRRPQ